MSHVLYNLLALVGYSHPIHPVFVHLPAGMSIGAFCFWLMAFISRQSIYRVTAYQLIVFAFISTFFTIPLGIFDWQRFYGEAWLFEIKMKMALAVLFFVIVAAAVIVGRRHNDSPVMPILYFSSVMTVIGLGFFGGQLVYQGFTPEAPKQFKVGRHVFESHCAGCHRRGENLIEPNMPLRNAPQLHDYNDFLSYIRDPRMPNGSVGSMPPFTLNSISDEEAKQLFDYLCFAFLTPNRPL